MTSSESPKDTFRPAADWVVVLVRSIPERCWDSPGLGEWSIRDLVGHTTRALSTISDYLTTTFGEPDLKSPLDYYRAMAVGPGPESAELHASIAERGRQAGAQMGVDPISAVTALRDSVIGLVDGADLNALANSRGGTIRLADYLPTRTLELVVHGLDLDRALRRLGVRGVPVAPSGALVATLDLLGDLAKARGGGSVGEVILAVTGRMSLPDGYSLL